MANLLTLAMHLLNQPARGGAANDDAAHGPHLLPFGGCVIARFQIPNMFGIDCPKGGTP